MVVKFWSGWPGWQDRNFCSCILNVIFIDRPKIRMPRALRACFIRQVGEQINLVIPFLVSQSLCISRILKVVSSENYTWPSLTNQGKPKPVVSWLKDGQPLDTKRVNIRNSDKDSILFIRASQREDSGVYEMSVKVDSFEDKSTITLQIVGEKPSHML